MAGDENFTPLEHQDIRMRRELAERLDKGDRRARRDARGLREQADQMAATARSRVGAEREREAG